MFIPKWRWTLLNEKIDRLEKNLRDAYNYHTERRETSKRYLEVLMEFLGYELVLNQTKALSNQFSQYIVKKKEKKRG